jgi:bifunctional UDP-N-acetylglucosamine pyrophosphorylase/glucosamine-1-phosphate N-acetyltransferase
MKSATHKALHNVCGKPMILHILDTLDSMELDQVIVVVGQQRETVTEAIAGRADIAVQAQQLGTGDAVRAALPQLRDDTESVVVLYADAPLIEADTLSQLFATRAAQSAAVAVLTANVADPTGLGRVFLDEAGTVSRVVEEKDASDSERQHRLINTGIYTYAADALRASVAQLTPDNAQGEYYLTDTLAILRSQGHKVVQHAILDADEIASVNDRAQLAQVEKLCRARIAQTWMKNGVTIVDPDSTYIESTVTLAADVTLLPGTILQGNTQIESFAQIGPNTRLNNTTVGQGATVQYAVAEDSEVGEAAQVGPFAYLRPGTKVGKRVKVGDFVEIKNSHLGDDTKVSHLAYVGDASIGAGVNVGCGVITVNYDGEQKHRTTVGDNSFVGSNVNLIAPVNIGEGVYICAGSTVTDDVEDDGFVIARPKQITKPNYVKRWKLRKKGQSLREGEDHLGH